LIAEAHSWSLSLRQFHMDVEFHNKHNMSNEYCGNLQLYWDLHIQLLIYVTICFFHLLIVWKLHIATATTIVMWHIFQFTSTFSFFNQLKNCKLYYNRNSLVILKKWKKFLIFHTKYLSELFCGGIAKTSYNRYSISYPEPDSTHGSYCMMKCSSEAKLTQTAEPQTPWKSNPTKVLK